MRLGALSRAQASSCRRSSSGRIAWKYLKPTRSFSRIGGFSGASACIATTSSMTWRNHASNRRQAQGKIALIVNDEIAKDITLRTDAVDAPASTAHPRPQQMRKLCRTGLGKVLILIQKMGRLTDLFPHKNIPI